MYHKFPLQTWPGQNFSQELATLIDAEEEEEEEGERLTD
jgi:hypothetical protein